MAKSTSPSAPSDDSRPELVREAADVAISTSGSIPFTQLKDEEHALERKVVKDEESFFRRNQVCFLDAFCAATKGREARRLTDLFDLCPRFLQHLVEFFVAGGLAGATSRTVVSPLERLKIIMYVLLPLLHCRPMLIPGPFSLRARNRQVQSAQTAQTYTGVWPGLKKMWVEEGLKGYMKGNGINILRIMRSFQSLLLARLTFALTRPSAYFQPISLQRRPVHLVRSPQEDGQANLRRGPLDDPQTRVRVARRDPERLLDLPARPRPESTEHHRCAARREWSCAGDLGDDEEGLEGGGEV